MATEPLRAFHVIERVVCIIVFIVSIWSILIFVDDLCQILNVLLNSIGCVTKCGPAGIALVS